MSLIGGKDVREKKSTRVRCLYENIPSEKLKVVTESWDKNFWRKVKLQTREFRFALKFSSNQIFFKVEIGSNFGLSTSNYLQFRDARRGLRKSHQHVEIHPKEMRTRHRCRGWLLSFRGESYREKCQNDQRFADLAQMEIRRLARRALQHSQVFSNTIDEVTREISSY